MSTAKHTPELVCTCEIVTTVIETGIGWYDEYNISKCSICRAAPAMYQSGTLTVDIMERVAKELERKGLEELRSLLRSAIIEQKQALAQAEGK